MSSLGKSVEGRDLWCLTVNNPETGPDRGKPAMYVDGNIHGNEIQGAEAALYLVWYLAENRGRVKAIKELTDERAFYVVPTVNPDGRALLVQRPEHHEQLAGRQGPARRRPRRRRRRGRVRRPQRRRPDHRDAAEEPARALQGLARRPPPARRRSSRARTGQYDLLGNEGVDNDGDGLVNEDPPGGYDMNRNWPADWQPDHVQAGAGDFPLCWPETRAVAEFLRDHPNVAGVQAFHNAAGMILRGPGHPSRQGEYPQGDERVAAEIGRVGERMIPFYRSLVIHKDLYNVHGGFVGWTYEHLGIFSFTNELWNNEQLLGRPRRAGDDPGDGRRARPTRRTSSSPTTGCCSAPSSCRGRR